jgi:prepilin-type N-terminal cleavage/methylation domain-containing protein
MSACGYSRRGFSLVETLVVITIIGVLASLCGLAMQGVSSAARLSTGGSQIADLLDQARERAILNQSPVAVVLLGAGATANHVFTALSYSASTATWVQSTKWQNLPSGIIANPNANSTDGSGNPMTAFLPSNSPLVSPALPPLTYLGTTYSAGAATSGYGYIIFLSDGSLYQDSNGFPSLPCVLQLIEGINQSSGTQYTGNQNTSGKPADYFEILVNNTGRVKILRP